MSKTFKNYLFPLFITLICIIIGVIFNDILWGTLSLIFGFLNAYYMALGKWQNYIYGLLFSVVYAYICTINGLYGLLIFTIVFYFPIQVFGLINWFKNKKDTEVKMKSLNLKSAIILCALAISGSGVLGLLLSLIPTQNLAFLDSTSQIINLCGVVMGSLRYREAWYIWIFNNLIDLGIWIINTAKHTQNAEMSLITACMYMIMNIIGLIAWIKIEHKQKNENKGV